MDRGTRVVIVSDLGDLSHPSDQLGTREITMTGLIDHSEQHREIVHCDLSRDQRTVPDETEELAASIVMEYKGASHLSSLETALYFLRRSLDLCLGDHSIQFYLLENLALARLVRFNWTGEIRDLDEAILLMRSKLTGVTLPQNSIRAQPEIEAVTEREQKGERDVVLENEHEASSMIKFALGVVTEFCNSGSISSIDSAIYLYRQVIDQRGHQNPKRFLAMYALADACVSRWFHSRQYEDLDEAISIFRDCLRLPLAPHPGPRLRARPCACLVMRFFLTGRTEAFTEATLLRLQHQNSDIRDAEALKLAEHGADIARSFTSEDITEVDSSIFFFQEAVGVMCEEHPLRCRALKDLVSEILVRFRQTVRRHDLDRASSLLKEVVQLLPTTDEGVSTLLGEVGDSLSKQFEYTKQAEDREKAISMYGKALMLCPVPHPNRSALLNNLAFALFTRFQQTGQEVDLDEAFSLLHKSLLIRPAPHPDRSASLNNLANAVQKRFEQTGQVEDLEQAISLFREALILHPPPDPYRAPFLTNLASALLTRLRQTGQAEDLEEAILLHRNALVLCPTPHPHRAGVFNNLAA